MTNLIKPTKGHVTVVVPKPQEPSHCEHRGEQVGIGKCGCAVPPPVFHCNKLNQNCIQKPKIIRLMTLNDKTEVPVEPKSFAVCQTCKYNIKDRLVYTRTEDLVRDTYKLVKYIPTECNGIVGVPRSGMIPASILAAHCQLPLGELKRDGTVRMLDAGSRGQFKNYPDGKIFIVDDSCHHGHALRNAKRNYKGPPAIWAVVYNREKNPLPDCYAVDMDVHCFAWNMFNNGQVSGQTTIKGLMGGFCMDLGVIMDKDKNPLLLPRLRQIPMVIAERPNSERQEIQEWLAKYGINVKQLVLCDNQEITAFKSRRYRDSQCSVFFESDINQCQAIANMANKPVIHPASGEVFYSE